MGYQQDNTDILRALLRAADQLRQLIAEAEINGMGGPGADTFTRALMAMIEGWCADYADQLAPSLAATLATTKGAAEPARLSELRAALDSAPS